MKLCAPQCRGGVADGCPQVQCPVHGCHFAVLDRIHTRSLFPYTGHLVGRKFAFSIWMEFMGLMLFSLFGNSVTPEFAPAGNGEQRERSRNKSASV